jgi:transcriptional regulator with XRE-family HTH domain
MTFSERLVFARNRIGITQKELGELTGLTEIIIRFFEDGKIEPESSNLRKIAIALRVSADYLLDIDIKELWGMEWIIGLLMVSVFL